MTHVLYEGTRIRVLVGCSVYFEDEPGPTRGADLSISYSRLIKPLGAPAFFRAMVIFLNSICLRRLV